MTPDDFRSAWPEFSDAATYTDDQITSWITIAGNLINVKRWGSLADFGTGLLVAHNLVLSQRDQLAAEVGNTPGEMTGPTANKAVDRVSVGYDVASATLKDAGDYALTSYGIRYLRLARTIGAGGAQITGCLI